MKVFFIFPKPWTLTPFPRKTLWRNFERSNESSSIESRNIPKIGAPIFAFGPCPKLGFPAIEPFDNLDQGSRIDQQIRLCFWLNGNWSRGTLSQVVFPNRAK